MAKLHEFLAIEGPLKAQADKTGKDLAHTFEKKRHLFSKKVETFIPLAEGAPAETIEQSNLETTVAKELKWISDIWTKAIDGAAAIAEANTVARADVILDGGKVLLKNVPATSLMELLKRATEIQELVQQIPNLDSAKNFTLDESQGKGIYKAREVMRHRTKKVQKALVLYEATKEHPAQVKEISEDVIVGNIQSQEWSGLITTADKADMIARSEELNRALKSALSRANSIEVPKTEVSIGKTMLSFVFGD